VVDVPSSRPAAPRVAIGSPSEPGVIWRIHERSAFERLSRQGRRVRVFAEVPGDVGAPGEHSIDRVSMWCSFVLDQAATHPHVAWAFGRAHGNAVVRNRLRRRAREALRTRAADLPAGFYLIGSSISTTELTFDQISMLMNSLVDRVVDRVPVRVVDRVDAIGVTV